LGSLVYLVLVAMENAAILTLARSMDQRLVENYDSFLCLVLVSILVIFHLIIVIHVQITVGCCCWRWWW
jgi:hypothetical protein